jgi:3-phenylpropionate/trans-cinnamate dioxygenase ferredoxin component
MAQFHDAIPADWIPPGKSDTVDVDGFPVAVANVDGEFVAFQNLCPHQGTRLGGRPLEEGRFITCPMHASRYDVLSGECVRPANGDGFDQDLDTYPCRVKDEIVQVEI